MPRTTKEASKELNKEKFKKAVSTTKKKTSQKSSNTSASIKKELASKSKSTSTIKKSSNTKKAATPKVKKDTIAKKTSAKKSTNKKSSSKKSTKKQNIKIDVLEYYDLPYRYNQTIVKVLAQTPKTLFVYWDISDNDRKSYIEQYGENFFENTKPVLIITNTTMNYTFEIEINDFANCWYFNINDEKCEYLVELGRRPKENTNTFIPNNYMYVTSSNKIESPNGHILFEKEQKTLYYRNVKTNETYSRDVANLNFMKRIGRIYKIYDIYQKLYKDEEILRPNNNPSSKFF